MWSWCWWCASVVPSVSPALRAPWALLCVPLLNEWLVDMLRKGKDFFFSSSMLLGGEV